MKNIRKKIKIWINRYYISEIISYILAIWLWTITFYYTKDYYISWIVVIIWDNIWYYWTMFVREIINTKRINKKYNLQLFLKDFRNLSFEFWIPQIIEIFIIYPLLIFYIPQLFTSYPIWVFIAMTIAVIIFYIQAITLYEIRKKYFK